METQEIENFEIVGKSLLIKITPTKERIIEEIIEENNCRIESKGWRSEYNDYVVYDYEPFCTEGFMLEIKITGNINKLQFLKLLIQQRLEQIKQLERCYNLSETHYEV